MWPRTSKQEEGGRSVLERQAGVRSVIPMEADIAIVHLGCLLECKYAQSCLTLCYPTDCSPPAPQSTEFTRQEYWSVLLFPLPGNLLNPGIEPTSLVSPALAGGFLTAVSPGKPPISQIFYNNFIILRFDLYKYCFIDTSNEMRGV